MSRQYMFTSEFNSYFSIRICKVDLDPTQILICFQFYLYSVFLFFFNLLIVAICITLD